MGEKVVKREVKKIRFYSYKAIYLEMAFDNLLYYFFLQQLEYSVSINFIFFNISK